jgi:HD-like signal output (HDOD) protein
MSDLLWSARPAPMPTAPLDPQLLGTLGARGAIETIARSGRTALVLLDRGARVGEIWLDRGRILCSDDLVVAAASLAELLAWPRPHITVVPGARRGGPCAAIPAAVVLHRASEIAEERLTSLSLLADPTEIHRPAEGAVPREGDVHERAVLAALAEGASPFSVLPVGRGGADVAAAVVRLVRRRAIVRAPPTEERRTSSERPTAPGATAPSGLNRFVSWVRTGLDGRSASEATRASTRPTRPHDTTTRPSCRVPGWRPSEAGDGAEASAGGEASWAVLPWDRDRAAIATTANEIASRLAEALPHERAQADLPTAALLTRLEQAVSRGLEDVAPMPALALELRDAISKETTAREVAAMIESEEAITRAVLRAGSAAAFGRPPATLEQAVVRVGLGRVYRIATAPIVRARAFEARVLGARTQRIRMACQLAGELAADLATGPAREDLFLAGLLHGLGRLYLATLADGVPRVAPARLDELAGAYQSSIGVLLAARWGLGPEVRLAIGAHPDAQPLRVDPSRSPEAEAAALPSALRVAQIVACAMTEDPPVPEWRIAKALHVREDAVPATGTALRSRSCAAPRAALISRGGRRARSSASVRTRGCRSRARGRRRAPASR